MSDTMCLVCGRPLDDIGIRYNTCERCEHTMRQQLRHLPDDASRILDELYAWRTLPGGRSNGDPAEGALPGGTDLLSASATLTSKAGLEYDKLANWDEIWRETRGLPPRDTAPTLTGVCDFLTVHLAWACKEFDAIDEFAAQLRDAVKVAQAVLADERTWVKFGRFKCPTTQGDNECGNQLWVDHTDQAWPAIACRACNARWEVSAWHLLGAVLARPVTVSEAASVLGVNGRTIQRWVKDGMLTNYGTDRIVKIRLDEVGQARMAS